MEPDDRRKEPHMVVEETLLALAERAAGDIALSLRNAARTRDLAAIAFSGGTTPALLLDALATEEVPWNCVHVFQVDERVAPDGDPTRNAVQLLEHLVSKVDLPEAHVHLMEVALMAPGKAARSYATTLRRVCDGVLDVVHLGLGDDGHTASLVPGDPALQVDTTLVATTRAYKGQRRVTLTYLALARAREIAWLATGDSKTSALKRLLVRDRSIPAGVVQPGGHETIYVDTAAAGDIRYARF